MDLKKIAQTLERQKCPKHGEKPKATAKGDSIQISCCCEEFKTKITSKMKAEITKQANADIEESIKKAFKR